MQILQTLRPDLMTACTYLNRRRSAKPCERDTRGSGVLADLDRFGRGD
jgi:hypothetical protein